MKIFKTGNRAIIDDIMQYFGVGLGSASALLNDRADSQCKWTAAIMSSVIQLIR
jgi:hypothetical protein